MILAISTTLHKNNREILPNIPLFSKKNITFQKSKSNLHRSEWKSMNFEHAHQKSAQSNHILTLIRARDQNCQNRKLTKIEALFSDWKTTVRNSKSYLHCSDWRSISHEPLFQISGRPAHRRSRIRPLMKSGQWKKKTKFFFLTSKWWFSSFLSFLLPSVATKNWKKKKKNDSFSSPFI